jgi:PAS domain S-box-containing protein
VTESRAGIGGDIVMDTVGHESAYQRGKDISGPPAPHAITGLQSPGEAVRISEGQLLALIEHHPAVMLLIDPDARFIANANRAASAFYGYSASKLRGMNIADISQREPAQIAAELERAKAEGLHLFTSVHRLANAEVRNVEIHASPISIEDRILLFSIVHDITEHKKCAEELKTNIASLEELNTALKVILQQVEKSREELSAAIVTNIGELVLPDIDNLKRSPLSAHQLSVLHGIESHLLNISSSFLKKLKMTHHKLTVREIEIATLVKEGKSTKEIAEWVNVSTKTVEFHRNRLREKLGLKKKKINLRSHLLTIE